MGFALYTGRLRTLEMWPPLRASKTARNHCGEHKAVTLTLCNQHEGTQGVRQDSVPKALSALVLRNTPINSAGLSVHITLEPNSAGAALSDRRYTNHRDVTINSDESATSKFPPSAESCCAL